MNKEFFDVLNRERKNLLVEKERLERVLVPDDGYYLEIKKNKGKYVQYYKCRKRQEDNCQEKVFIRKSDLDIAKSLAQGEFNRKLYMDVNARLNKIDSLLNYYIKNRKNDLYSKISMERKALIEGSYLDDKAFIMEWLNSFFADEDANFNEKYPIETPYYTERGEHVRSKSEMIIADKLTKAGVPYVYEPKCDLNKRGLHPDFALLNIETRETFLYEHFGMMDNPEYASMAVRKIAKYRELGYEYGQNFLYTFETGSDGLNINDLNRIINIYWQK